MIKGTVLCVDDDENLQTVLGYYLEDERYSVIKAENVATALHEAHVSALDVILLDLVLPDGEGISLIPQFKAKTNAAIIIVSGKSDTTEKIVCLEMGADDYITKPFEMRELAARIKAVMRRRAEQSSPPLPQATAQTTQKIEFNDGWLLDRDQLQLYAPDGTSADLTTGEFRLLEALILAANRVLNREHLFDLTREGRFDAFDRAIDIQIARIRKKIGDAGNEIIKTVRGAGYMFCGTIRHQPTSAQS